MSVSLARLAFCRVPAVLVETSLGCIAPFFGFIGFAAIRTLGLSVTEREFERGE